MYTYSVLLKGKSDQAPANEFLLLGNEHRTCNTLFTSTHTHTHSLTSGCCVYKMTLRVCGCVPVSSASTEQSLLTRPWFVLGTASWVTTPPEREKENTMKTGSQFLDDRKKSQGKMAYVVLQPQ